MNKEAGSNNVVPFGGSMQRLSEAPESGREVFGRTRLDNLLAARLDQATRQRQALSLLLLNPDDFAAVNERLGWETGAEVLREIESRVRTCVRRSDHVIRLAGASIAILIDSPPRWARKTAEKILRQLRDEPYHRGDIHLRFSVGIAAFDPGSEEPPPPADLLLRATRSLSAAKRLGGGRSIEWIRELSGSELDGPGQSHSVFTGSLRRDYRNMILLWSTVNSMAESAGPEELTAHLVDHIWRAFLPDRIGIFERRKTGETRLVRGVTRVFDSEDQPRIEGLEPSALELELVALAISEAKPRQAPGPAADPRISAETGPAGAALGSRVFAFPLLTGSECLGALLLSGREPALALSESDQTLLQGLGSQLALALDRFRLAERDRRRCREEHRRLEEELRQLRQALKRVKLVYASPEMEELLERSRRVAATDATVLITGDSGTGKEVLARTIHELSARRDQPFVVVDCSAIATSLIERELFGNEKGAYTGAERSRPGLIVQAEGGSVMLDEIGELPLEVQSKLLRIVQEKELTPVGGTRPLKVNARIIACTNRDLHAEVKKGRFREGLYHRMNVVRLQVPPLRERRADILPLARYFLESLAVQFQLPVPKLTPEAEQSVLRYPWPGNVRELQNRLMQAIIFSQASHLGCLDLGLEEDREETRRKERDLEVFPDTAADVGAEAPPSPEPIDGPDTEAAVALWEKLRQALERQVAAIEPEEVGREVPLGRWLSEEVARAVAEHCGNDTRRAAELLDVSPATCRRWLRKAAARRREAPRPAKWLEIREALAELVRLPLPEVRSVGARAERLLLADIVARFPGRSGVGAALLGVSAPTFRHRVQRIVGLEP